MKINIIIVLIGIVFGTGINDFPQTNGAGLIGKWESVDSKPPKLLIIEFKADNDFVLTNLLVADYKYKLEGSLLISTIEKEYPQKKIIIDTSYLQIKQDTIIRSYNRLGWKDTVTMIRDRNYKVKSQKSDNIMVGKWKWAYPMGDTATAVFNNNGTWHFSYPQDIYKGVFNVNTDTLSVKLDNSSKAQISTYRVEGKLLVLQDLKTGNQILYRKVYDY